MEGRGRVAHEALHEAGGRPLLEEGDGDRGLTAAGRPARAGVRRIRTRASTALLALLAAALGRPAGAVGVEEIVLDRDDLVVVRDARIVVPEGVQADAAGDGVVRIEGDGITVEFVGAVLRGAAPGISPDAYAGMGVVVRGRGVTVRGLRASGFRVGLLAEDADDLRLEDCAFDDLYRQRLGSTPAAEDAADWLRPHENDANEWFERYGAAVAVVRAEGPRLRNVRVRRGQNGIVLSHVRDGRVEGCDASFLSGWGLAMWRCVDCTVARNQFDFCVRGYSHGVYNRGQDSAGILVFEQCVGNLFVENSATHGGDGYFGFSGLEALGERGPDAAALDRRRVGNRANRLVGNDFSHAVAHGIETTFAFDEQIVGNVLRDCGICGVWGGYAEGMLVEGNLIEGNGTLGYGRERGGVNVEHGRENTIRGNAFARNVVGVALWWDEDAGLAEKPWARANGVESRDNAIVGNDFRDDRVGVELRRAGRTFLGPNAFAGVGAPLDLDAESEEAVVERAPSGRPRALPIPDLHGPRVVGARAHLGGREAIVMTEWGPWDHASPLLQPVDADGAAARWRSLRPADGAPVGAADAVRLVAGDVELAREPDGAHVRVTPTRRDALTPYALALPPADGDDPSRGTAARGTLLDTTWRARFAAWTVDPREDAEALRRAIAEHGVDAELPRVDLRFGGGGPSDARLALSPALVAADLPADRVGGVIEGAFAVPAGEWTIRTVSDDGIRVWIDDALVIDDWTWHAPRAHAAPLVLAEARRIAMRIEWFELDGWAVLQLGIEPSDAQP